jgi:CDP-4-dehydro-6-deoxyglucose reductase, E3
MPSITLSNGKTFNAHEALSILDSARNAGIVLEHSCRTGKCGVCKAKVIQGEAQPLQDLGKLANIKKMTLPCKIDSLNLLAHDVVQIFLRLPPNQFFQYIPGQYIDVINKDIRRSYSIANAPAVDGKIELHIRKLDQGKMSDYWFNRAKANDLLRLDGPHGTFGFREQNPSKIIMMATGTGIAPLKAILEDLDRAQLNLKSIDLFWGGRTSQDLYWNPSFNNIQVKLHRVLSRSPDSWQGLKGYVQDAVLSANYDLSNASVYACGSQKMIESSLILLESHGLPTKSFFSDAFVSS